MDVPRDKKKIEALARMKMLGVHPEIIRQFEEKDQVSISDSVLGTLHFVSNTELDFVQEFEETYNALVYMVVHSYTDFGEMDCCLYVSDHKDEWEDDRENIVCPDNGLLAYAYNYDMPDCSEIGYIGILKSPSGVLRRAW